MSSKDKGGAQAAGPHDPARQKTRGPSGRAQLSQGSTTAARATELTPEIAVTRVAGYAVVDYRVRSSEAVRLVLTVDSPTDPRGPATFGVDLRERRAGRKRLPLPLEDFDDYTVLASVFTEAGAERSRVVSVRVP